MYTETDRSAFIWRETKDGAEILRVYADMPQISIPEEIDGRKVVSVGAYCFSEVDRLNRFTGEDIVPDIRPPQYMAGFYGNYVEKIVLPDSVEKIGDNAFYNCRKLLELEAGAKLKEAGSDIFMNCNSFTKLGLRHRADCPGGLKQLVSRFNSSLEVYFYDGGKTSAMLFYPEYTDSYDEIAPAHIFGRNITGEGFRARQCFSGDVPDLYQYDLVFARASVEESVNVIYKMALGRLMYPFKLTKQAASRYGEYLRANQGSIMEILVDLRSLDALGFMCKNRYADAAGIDKAVARASASGWGEGTANLLRWKHTFIEDIKKSRYDFG